MKQVFDLLNENHELLFKVSGLQLEVGIINNTTLKQKSQTYPLNSSHAFDINKLAQLVKWLIDQTN